MFLSKLLLCTSIFGILLEAVKAGNCFVDKKAKTNVLYADCVKAVEGFKFDADGKMTRTDSKGYVMCGTCLMIISAGSLDRTISSLKGLAKNDILARLLDLQTGCGVDRAGKTVYEGIFEMEFKDNTIMQIELGNLRDGSCLDLRP